MIAIVRLVMTSSLLLTVPPLSLAMQLKGQTAQGPASVDTTGTVERGGTINIVNLTKKTLVIDSVNYPLPTSSVPLYGASGKALSKNFVLKAGMQIRFNTSKKNGAKNDEIREIWVLGLDGKTPRP